MKRVLFGILGCIFLGVGGAFAQSTVQKIIDELPTRGEGAFLKVHRNGFRIFAIGQAYIDDPNDGDDVLRAERMASMQARKSMSAYISQKMSAMDSMHSEYEDATQNTRQDGKETEESQSYSFEQFSSDMQTSTKHIMSRLATVKTIHVKQGDNTYAKVLMCFNSGHRSRGPVVNGNDEAVAQMVAPPPNLPKHEWIVCIGRGKNRHGAIQTALVEGVQQVYGAYLENNETYKNRFAMLKANGEKHKESSNRQTSKTLTATKGFVNAYRIISVDVVEQNLYQAKINAEFVNPRAGGLRAVMLYPMEMPVDKETNSYLVSPGMRLSGKELGALCGKEFEKAFTEANKFLVLNQADLRQAVREHQLTESLISKGLGSPAELAKAGKLLTADYIVTSSFGSMSYTRKLKYNKKTRKFGPNERIVFNFSYTMFDVKSGQQMKNSTLEVVLPSEDIQKIREGDEDMTEAELSRLLFRVTMDMAVQCLAEDAKI